LNQISLSVVLLARTASAASHLANCRSFRILNFYCKEIENISGLGFQKPDALEMFLVVFLKQIPRRIRESCIFTQRVRCLFICGFGGLCAGI
ncbi:MAG: hypothetical protein ACOYCD_09695, partial [Kiritimatiellia bacterium]